jgi:hypothetical protein
MSAFYIAAYGSLSVPAIRAGVVVSAISSRATFEIFGSVVAAIGVVVAFGAWFTRPARPTRAPRNRRYSLTQHPETHLIEVVCATRSAAFTVRSTAASLSVDVCSSCHPA